MTDDPIKTLKKSERDLEDAIRNLRTLKREIHGAVGFLTKLKELGVVVRKAVETQDNAVENVWKKNDVRSD